MKLLASAAIAALMLAGGYAVAQTIPVPTQTPNAADLSAFIPGGQPQARSTYASVGLLSGTENYTYLGTLVTTNAYTFTNGMVLATAHAAGTLAAIGLTTEPNPGDGKRECFDMDAIVSTLTWTANTGQSLGGNISANATLASVPRCIIYSAGNATWYLSN